MKKQRILLAVCFCFFSVYLLAGGFLPEKGLKDGYEIQLKALKSSKSDFTPSIKPHVGLIFKTSLQQAGGGDSINFQPGVMKLGFAGFMAKITPKVSAVALYRIHGNGAICDAFVQYKPTTYLDIKLGRFKGSGAKAVHETSAYDLEIGEFTYLSENMSEAQGAPDLRHFGLDVSAKCKWGKAGFFLHNSDQEWPGYFSTKNDGPRPNRGLSFKSWDASLIFTLIKQLEFGGHLGSVNLPGMGSDSKMAHSAFLYLIEPGVYKFRFDYGHYYKIDLGGLNYKDYTPRPWSSVEKKGFSFLGAYNINKEFEVVARFERADHAILKDELLTMYTLALNYYIPYLSNRNRITLYAQLREEKKQPIRNNLICIQYQFVL